MVELVDTTALEAVAARCEGSSPSLGTREIKNPRKGDFIYATRSIFSTAMHPGGTWLSSWSMR